MGGDMLALGIQPRYIPPVRTRFGYTSGIIVIMEEKLMAGGIAKFHHDPTVKRSAPVYLAEKSNDYGDVLLRAKRYFNATPLDPMVYQLRDRFHEEAIKAGTANVFKPFTKITRADLEHITRDEIRKKYSGDQYRVAEKFDMPKDTLKRGNVVDVIFEIKKLEPEARYWKMGGSHFNFNMASRFSDQAARWAEENLLNASLQAFHLGVITANSQPRAMETVYKDFLHAVKHFIAAGMENATFEIYESLIKTVESDDIPSFLIAKSLAGSAMKDAANGKYEKSAANFERAIVSANGCFYPEVKENALFAIATALSEAAVHFMNRGQDKRIRPIITLLKARVESELSSEAIGEINGVLQKITQLIEKPAISSGQPLVEPLVFFTFGRIK